MAVSGVICVLLIFVTTAVTGAPFEPREYGDIGEFKNRDVDRVMDVDILLTPAQQKDIFRQSLRQKRRAVLKAKQWKNGIIPYEYQDEVFSDADKFVIEKAMQLWSDNTCVQFKPRTDEDEYIVFVNSNRCAAYIGWQNIGRQTVMLGSHCRTIKTVVHELGHALGLYHEHNRVDRNDFVTVDYMVIDESFRQKLTDYSKLEAEASTTHNVSYDYFSIMHYSPWAFTRGFLASITTKDSRYQDVIGRGVTPSFADYKIVNIMYGCFNKCTDKTPCSGNGYRDKNCKCKCQSAWYIIDCP